MRSVSKHLTYANVMSTLAVFLLLGGSAYASGLISGSRIENGSISGRKLKAGSVSNSKLRTYSVTNGKIKRATITGGRIASNTLTDREINMAKLGKIASAANADKVGAKTASQLTDRCPSGTVDLGSACAENGVRSSATGYAAAKACVQAGGYLPQADELVGADQAGKISISADEWSGSWASGPSGTLVGPGGVAGSADPSAAANPYRCFFSPRER
jgi:hypothetical protein